VWPNIVYPIGNMAPSLKQLLAALLGFALALCQGRLLSMPPKHDGLQDRAVAANGSAGCGQTAFASGTKTASVNGRQRQFIVRVPKTYDSSKPYKLIFAFHWVGGTMNDVSSGGTDKELWSYYGLQRQAQEAAILVAPQGISNGWGNSGGEDIQFLDAMIKQIEGALCVDQGQRFALGFSYGGASESLHAVRPQARTVGTSSGLSDPRKN